MDALLVVGYFVEEAGLLSLLQVAAQIIKLYGGLDERGELELSLCAKVTTDYAVLPFLLFLVVVWAVLYFWLLLEGSGLLLAGFFVGWLLLSLGCWVFFLFGSDRRCLFLDYILGFGLQGPVEMLFHLGFKLLDIGIFH